MNIQIQESQPSSSKINKENYTELYYNQIVETKTSKSWKHPEEKKLIIYKGFSMRLSVDFLPENFQAQRQ